MNRRWRDITTSVGHVNPAYRITLARILDRRLLAMITHKSSQKNDDGIGELVAGQIDD